MVKWFDNEVVAFFSNGCVGKFGVGSGSTTR